MPVAAIFMPRRQPPRQVVGTSLLVITGTCVVGFLGYLGQVRLDWPVVAILPSILRRGFAVFLVVIAAITFLENLGPLSAGTRVH